MPPLTGISLSHGNYAIQAKGSTMTGKTDTNVVEVVQLNALVESVYTDHLNASITGNDDATQTVRDLFALINSKQVTADDTKATIQSIWSDTKIKSAVIKAGHVQDLGVTVYILDIVTGAQDEKLSTILTLATRVRKDVGTKGFKAHVQANSASVKKLREATRTTAKSAAETAESAAETAQENLLDTVAVADITIESMLDAFKVFLTTHKDIVVTDKPLLKGVIHALMALDKVSA